MINIDYGKFNTNDQQIIAEVVEQELYCGPLLDQYKKKASTDEARKELHRIAVHFYLVEEGRYI